MSLPILLFLQAVAQQPTPPPLPPTPRREIPDPGIIATDQRVTPAGLQSVFTGRVTGVRFGAHPAASGGDSVVLQLSSLALGAYIAGSPALARRPNSSGHRVVVVPLPANDELAVLDATDGSLLKKIALGVLPLVAVVNEDGSVAYVSNLGGRKPTARDRSAKQCCDPFAELVRVDARGMGPPGSVTRVDLV